MHSDQMAHHGTAGYPQPGIDETAEERYVERETGTIDHEQKAEPVEVIVLAQPPAQRYGPRHIVTDQVFLKAGVVTKVANRNNSRTRLLISAHVGMATDVFIGRSWISPTNGYLLSQQGATGPAVVELTATGNIWGLAPNDDVTVHVLQELTED